MLHRRRIQLQHMYYIPPYYHIVHARKQMANGKTMGLDNLSAELLKLAVRGDRKIPIAIHKVILAV